MSHDAPHRARPAVVAPLVGLLLALVVGCASRGAAGAPAVAVPASASAGRPTPAADDLAQPDGPALAALARLRVDDHPSAAGYVRDAFGYRAFDTDRNGCDTRNDILRRDLTGVVVKAGTNGCVVLSGTLADPYSGTSIAFTRGTGTSGDVQIDHVVALGDAWRSGAAAWTDDERHRLGNDPLNLLAVSGPLNTQKGDKATDAWLPPNVGYRCAYVARQVEVKLSYALSVTTSERRAMAAVLSSCPGQALPEATPTDRSG